jgi:hypothetical protein
VPMLTDVVDAVIGVDTHRDTHHAEIAHPSGAVIATCSVRNTSAGYAQLLGPPACPWTATRGLYRGDQRLRRRAASARGRRGRAHGDRVRAAHPARPAAASPT